jgi:hypothetical protein
MLLEVQVIWVGKSPKKTSSNTGTMTLKPKKDSPQHLKASWKKGRHVSIDSKDTLIHTHKLVSIDFDEISDQMQMNNQDESFDNDSRQETMNRFQEIEALSDPNTIRIRNRKRPKSEEN